VGGFVAELLGEVEVGAAWDSGLEEAALEVGDAGGFVADDGDDGDAEELLESVCGDGDAAALGDVGHAEGDEHRTAELDELADEVEVAGEVGGVDDDDDGVGGGGVGALAAEDLAGDDLVGGSADEGVGAGEVDDVGPGLGAVGGDELGAADLFLDGDAGVVGDLLTEAGEGVEEGCFAGVGVSGEGDGAQGEGG
jgi:hypothetical protein